MEIYVRVDRVKPPLCTMSVCTFITGLVLVGHGIVDKDTGIIQIVFGSFFLLLCFVGGMYAYIKRMEPVIEVQQITVHSNHVATEHSTVNPIIMQPNAQSDCCVCMDAGRNIAFIPCGHSVCGSCDGKLTLCPVCRTPIADRLRLY